MKKKSMTDAKKEVRNGRVKMAGDISNSKMNEISNSIQKSLD